MIVICPCGEEVGYGALSTAEERARGMCLRCETIGPPAPAQPDTELVELCRRAWEARISGAADHGLEFEVRRYPMDDRRAACRSIGMETM